MPWPSSLRRRVDRLCRRSALRRRDHRRGDEPVTPGIASPRSRRRNAVAQLCAPGGRLSGLSGRAVGTGFSHIKRLGEIVWAYALDRGCRPELRSTKAEQIVADAEFDFAFSMNVMEHVDDVQLVLGRVLRALRPGAAYRFLCPNDSFPYEPHFDMPTLFSKSFTGRVLRSRILGSHSVIDPVGTWQSLNWISVASVRRTCRRDLGLEPEFDRTICYRFVRRAIDDPGFSGATQGFSARCAQALTPSVSPGCSPCCRREPNRPCPVDHPARPVAHVSQTTTGIRAALSRPRSVRLVPMAHGRTGRSRRLRGSHDQGSRRCKSAGHWLRHWRLPQVPPVRRGLLGIRRQPGVHRRGATTIRHAGTVQLRHPR